MVALSMFLGFYCYFIICIIKARQAEGNIRVRKIF